ncbi:bifunctional abietadiene synthase, chloroplastic-like isoform X2 [Phalaenopsis equestris]|uniref:bifunctional abietadiene synthase, chloroplastic-like isoform X2 n=1 Tax=Phalaenopsis equestris TaxID=78828 RepID=UPI0009E4C0F2|nr:bifunctional abietadiene synthase, chloroplastic-like isoform X2 [Phalaenopsis equestris]
MRSFTNSTLLSKSAISSHTLSSNYHHLGSLSFSNFSYPAVVRPNYFHRSRPTGVGALKVISEGALEKKTDDPSPSQLNTFDPDEDENEGRIESLVKEIKELFSSIGDGEVNPSAYDTAWIARIPSIDDPTKPLFPRTLEWIMKNQLEDGSWGESTFFSLYDRLVCTLSCIITLTKWSQGDELIARGLHFLQTRIQDLGNEKSVRTVGFEMIFPSMLNEAKTLGLHLPYHLPCMKHIIKLREEKMRRILKLQCANGSMWDSPSATVATYLNTNDEKCFEYLTYIVKRFKDHAPFTYPLDTFERGWMIDTIQRLGIDHHFREEIFDTLDYLYRYLRKDGLGWEREAVVTDIDDTCMGLRLLRLHGYPVSSDVLEYFKDNNDTFLCFMGETHKGVSEFFNLYRFSQIAFPGEKILKEAKKFAEQHLKIGINDNQAYDKWAIKKALQMEIEWGLRNEWKMSLPRLDAQEYIRNYGENDVWIGKSVYRMYYINNSKYLELAKLEHNKLHAMHTREANSILTWWNSYGFDDPLITLLNPKEIHLSICTSIYEEEFSASRIAYTKWNCIENILKDMFQSYESIEELKLFCQAINEWKPALVQVLPTKLKRVFMGVYDTMNELETVAKNAQGKDIISYLHDLRKKQVQQYLYTREVKDTKQIESFEEYVDHVKNGLAVAIRLVPAMFLVRDALSAKALEDMVRG